MNANLVSRLVHTYIFTCISLESVFVFIYLFIGLLVYIHFFYVSYTCFFLSYLYLALSLSLYFHRIGGCIIQKSRDTLHPLRCNISFFFFFATKPSREVSIMHSSQRTENISGELIRRDNLRRLYPGQLIVATIMLGLHENSDRFRKIKGCD